MKNLTDIITQATALQDAGLLNKDILTIYIQLAYMQGQIDQSKHTKQSLCQK